MKCTLYNSQISVFIIMCINNIKYLKTNPWPIIHEKKQVLKIKCPSLEHFKKNFMDLKIPVVIQDAVNYWPAFSDRPWR